MNNLNKENFFDAMLEKYPKAMQDFRNWIDEYKFQVNWSSLFNEQEIRTDTYYHDIQAPKFHDLPYELQYGIIVKYCTEKFGEDESWIPMDIMRELFEGLLSDIDREA